ncbi:hypothetical protein FG386_000627 [Cryptosporidium ryanae]|uniref:uncharacterized protein n=1 Tax=Cryptosporidium ryanae TaxID=515981 RepID=UPI00351AB0CA|nr:hypothetical protein FG386_000627 [Cryptosporidium ryanae]
MRNKLLFGVLLLLIIVLNDSECLKVRAFLFGLGGGGDNEKKKQEGSDVTQKQGESGKPEGVQGEHKQPSETPKQGDQGKSEGQQEHKSPNETPKQDDKGKPEGKQEENGSSTSNNEHGILPFIPSPPPPAPLFSNNSKSEPADQPGHHGSPEHSDHHGPPLHEGEEKKASNCSCSGEAKPTVDCCHEAIFGKSEGLETHNAKITGTITGTITDTTLVTKTGDLISIKNEPDRPVPESDKKEHPSTSSHETEIREHKDKDETVNKSKQLETKGESRFPNGAVFLPLVLDANTGQYGVELKSIDLLSMNKEEKIKPYDMLIPFLNEEGQIKFVTRRRLRQLVKSGLSKGLSDAFGKETHNFDGGNDDKETESVSSVLGYKDEKKDEKDEKKDEKDEKKDEKDEKKEEKDEKKEEKDENSGKGSSVVDAARNAAKSAKELLQEAESVLTGGSLFESSEKEKSDGKDKKEENKNDKEHEKDEDEGDNKNGDNKDSEDSKEDKKDENKDKGGDKDENDNKESSENSDEQDDIVSTHESEEEEEE